jgi:hypothetical protein
MPSIEPHSFTGPSSPVKESEAEPDTDAKRLEKELRDGDTVQTVSKEDFRTHYLSGTPASLWNIAQNNPSWAGYHAWVAQVQNVNKEAQLYSADDVVQNPPLLALLNYISLTLSTNLCSNLGQPIRFYDSSKTPITSSVNDAYGLKPDIGAARVDENDAHDGELISIILYAFSAELALKRNVFTGTS